MKNIVKNRLSRRTLLKGSGVALALPLLPSLAPRAARSQESDMPRRLLYWHIPNGVNQEDWDPEVTGPLAATDLPRSLAHLANAGVHEDINVLSGLDNLPATPPGFGDHNPGVGGQLTCVIAARPELRVGISADQIASQALGHLTPLPSLQLGMEGVPRFCDTYNCHVGNALSWSDETTPLAGRRDPKEVWDLLTGGYLPDSAGQEEAERRRRAKKSVLDYVLDQAHGVHSRLGTTDKVKLDQYMTSVRELEQRIARAPAPLVCRVPDEPREDLNYGEDYPEIFALMMDLQIFALECDLTRFITFMYATAFGPGDMPWAGVNDDYHDMTHNEGPNREKILQCIDWEVQQFAQFVARCKATPEGNGSLLDNMALCASSDVGRGAWHNHDRLPVLLAGRGGGAWTPGRHLHFEPEDGGDARRAVRNGDRQAASDVPNTNKIANLHLTLLESVGVSNATLGNSDAPLSLI